MKAALLLIIGMGMGVLGSATAFAAIPRSAVNSEVIRLYGMYTTSDPFCQTGLVASIPLTTTPLSKDLTQAPDFGSTTFANPINCIVFILQNKVSFSWASGNYTTTSNSQSDSVCNAGGSADAAICVSQTANWVSAIAADMRAAGLSMTTNCVASPTQNEIVAVYVSSTASCFGNTTVDTAAGRAGTCVSSGSPTNNTFQYPTSSGDAANGVRLLSAVGPNTGIRLVIDPDSALGNGTSNGVNTCRTVNAPVFKLR